MTSSSTLGGVAAVSQLTRRSHLHPVQIIPASDETPGEWAPCRTLYKSGRACACKCVDTEGYHRAKHSPDSDGRCIFCDRRS